MRWGILGTGRIAFDFVLAVQQQVPSAEFVAVGSRKKENAEDFAKNFGIKKTYGSYEELVQDPEVEVIYVATPHNFHREHSLLCLQHGKHVLCEKPIAINAKEAEDIFNFAKEKKLFCMEAMWSRFMPVWCAVREHLKKGMIGDVRLFSATYGGNIVDQEGQAPKRILDPELAGGSLLDLGDYLVSLSNMVFGDSPSDVTAKAQYFPSGVDSQVAMILNYGPNRTAFNMSCFITDVPNECYIAGSKGSIKVHAPFWASTKMTIKTKNEKGEEAEKEENFDFPKFDNKGKEFFFLHSEGLFYQAIATEKYIQQGKLESEDVLPHSESLKSISVLDTIRKQIQVQFPQEKKKDDTPTGQGMMGERERQQKQGQLESVDIKQPAPQQS